MYVVSCCAANDQHAVCRAEGVWNLLSTVRAVAPISIHDELVFVSSQRKQDHSGICSPAIDAKFYRGGIPVVESSGDIDFRLGRCVELDA